MNCLHKETKEPVTNRLLLLGDFFIPGEFREAVELINVPLDAPTRRGEGTAIRFAPADIVHFTHSNISSGNFFNEGDMTVVAVLGRDDVAAVALDL